MQMLNKAMLGVSLTDKTAVTLYFNKVFYEVMLQLSVYSFYYWTGTLLETFLINNLIISVRLFNQANIHVNSTVKMNDYAIIQ